MNLQDAIDLYLGEYIPTTRANYAWHLTNMATYIGPARPISEIDQADLLKYAQHVRASGLAPSSIYQRIKTMKGFFRWLEKTKIISTTPANAVRNARLPRSIDADKAMSDDEFHQILAYFRQRAPHYYTMQRNTALFLFLGDTGCRVGAARRLTLDDLDLDNKQAFVWEKGGKRCVVFYGDAAREEIRKWLLRRPASAGIYVFSQSAKPLTSYGVSQIIRRACKKLGLRTMSGHHLRHRKGHQMAHAGVPVSVTATVLNHDNVRTTLEFYYPADLKSARDAVEKLSEPAPETAPNITQFPTGRKSS